MTAAPLHSRPSGLPAPAELAWGTHFCVFHASAEERLEVIVPYLKAGLEANERCAWEIAAPLTVEQATAALAAVVPDLDRRIARGQLELAPRPAASAPPTGAAEHLERRLDQAILAGFDGLRLVCHADPEASEWALGPIVDQLHRLNVLVAVMYPRARLGAVGLMKVMQDHGFALVKNADRWEVLEGSAVGTARDALLRSEEKLASLFHGMSEGFAYHRIVLDERGAPCDYVFLEVNPAFERLTGLESAKIVGRRVTQVLPGIARDPTDWIGRYGKVALTGEPAHFESRAEALDRWYAVSAFCPHKGFFAVTFADVTDQKRAERAVQESEERLRVTLRSIGDAVIAADTAGRVTLMNRVSEELTGWSEAEARGRPLAEVFRIINEDTGEPAEDPVRKVLDRGMIVGLANHTALVARDGRRIAIADSAAPVRSDTALLGVVLVFRDVTEARRAERERDATVELLRIVNAAADAPGLLAATTAFFQAESGCEAVGIRLRDGGDYPYFESRGFPPEFLLAENRLCEVDGARIVVRDDVGNPLLSCMCGNVIRGRVDPAKPFFTAGGSFWTNCTTRLLATTTEADRQARTRNRCNGEGYESVALIPIRAGRECLGLLQLNDRRTGRFSPERIALWERLAGHVAATLGRFRAEGTLRGANARLAEADRSKNDFLAVLSHELRNPLAPMRNSLYILDRAAPGGEQALRAQEVIRRQVEQLARLVDDLLDVTRISRNKIQLQRRRFELHDLVRRVAEDYRYVFELAEVQLGMDDAEPPVFVHADWNRMAQVVGNLLQNAAKFTPAGGRVTVSVAVEPSTGRAVVRVADSGVGLAPDTLARLFQPFVQADQTLDRSKGGLGLGLALVKGIVELHGGAVEVHSDGLGQGSAFTVRLPLDGSAGDEPCAPAPRRSAASRHILVVEDNADAADTLREVLELCGHRVDVARDGPEGVAKAREFRPEVVLCDVGLPGMDGYQVARALRGDPALRSTVVVALSGYAQPEDQERARVAGFDCHLAKPASLEKIEELLAGLP